MAMLFIIGIGIFIGTYLKMANRELEFADSSFMFNSLLNQAEAAAEEAAWAFNNCKDDIAKWVADGWTSYTSPRGPCMRKMIGGTSIDLGNGKYGTIYIIVENYDGDPVLYVEARTTLLGGRGIYKQIEIVLTPASLFDAGLTARNKIDFSGSVAIDSYDSSDGAYTTFPMNDKVTIGSVSAALGAVKISGTKVYGYVGTGGSDPVWGVPVTVGEIGGPAGVDPNRVSTSFTATFEDPAPDPFTTIPKTSLSVPTPPGKLKIGDPSGQLWEYHLTSDDLTLNGNEILEIVGPVVIVMEDKGVSVSGGAKIVITDGGSLKIYTDKDINISGDGLVNKTQVASNLIVYGTHPVAQSIDISGNASLAALTYAPNANAKFSGDMEMFGAVIANNITLSGNPYFHFDEALNSFFEDSDVLEMVSWREMVTAEERKEMKAILYQGFGLGSYPYYP